MSDIASNDATPKTDSEKPVRDSSEVVKIPPFPDPTNDDFEDDITEEEKNYYKLKFPDLNDVKSFRLHCTACDRHLGNAARNESRMRQHPMLRTLMCNTCHTFYNSGEFEKGEDGSELYCRWCGQGGQVYCCADCEHVFCAKCIKRNFGMPKIKEIENTDDWKCFKCEPRCLWDHRAVCWALLRFCDLKNKLAYSTTDLKLKEAYQKSCALDDAVCCKNKVNKRKSREDLKKAKIEKVDVENSNKTPRGKDASETINKLPPTIQVKKFASINLDESPKRAQKRPASPKNKIFVKNMPIPALAPNSKVFNTVPILSKKMKLMSNIQQISPARFSQPQNVPYLPKVRPKPPSYSLISNNPMILNGMNNTGAYSNNSGVYSNNSGVYSNNSGAYSNNSGFSNNTYRGPGAFNNLGSFSNLLPSDNINLSLEELTQGLDFNAVAAMASQGQDAGVSGGDVVCTPDFPMEPLCEVTEDNTDDDVECISAPRKVSKTVPPPLAPRAANTLPDLSPENIVQMTDNDVTVNPATGGLKFRVDPQTLSSNKMYRLPDGRIFSINSNPQMPGGYSATIVAVSENNKTPKAPPKGATYAARLSAVMPAGQSKAGPKPIPRPTILKVTATPSKGPPAKGLRELDLKVPIEWYRYNLVDAVDAIEYSLSRLQKLKKEATTQFLRTRTVDEMRNLHKVLDRVLNTSSSRFREIQSNLNKGFKTYLQKKKVDKSNECISDDDDDVEILDTKNDDPIFIDENSVDSIADDSQPNKTQEVDLTSQGSVLNDSNEKSMEQIGTTNKTAEANGPDNVHSSNLDNVNVDDILHSSADVAKDTGEDSEKPGEDPVNEDITKERQEIGNSTRDSPVEDNVITEDNGKTDEIDGSPYVNNVEESILGVTEMINAMNEPLKDNIVSTPDNEYETEGNTLTESNDDLEEKMVYTKEPQSDTVEGQKNPRNADVTDDDMQVTELLEDKNQDTEMPDDLIDNLKSQDTEMTEDLIENLLRDDIGDDVGENLSLLDIPDLHET